MHIVKALQVIQADTNPTLNGARLGQYLRTNERDLSIVTIDMRELDPANVCSAFVNSMLHHAGISTTQAAVVNIKWLTKFPKQAQQLDDYLILYQNS